MKYILVFLFLSFSGITLSQDYAAVDERVKAYPKKIASAEDLATQIQKDFKSEKEKVRALYTWLALNIEYDGKMFFGNTENSDLILETDKEREDYMVNLTLETNRAVCEGYARTFKKACELMNIPCSFVTGYSKLELEDLINIPERGMHAWNAVKIDEKWLLIDVTWGAGASMNGIWKQKFNDFYFFTEPEEFSKNHLPEDEIFLLTDKKVGKKEFFNTPFFFGKHIGSFFKIKNPLYGKIEVKRNSEIQLILEKGNLPENYLVGYQFNDGSGDLIKGEIKNGEYIFKIPFNLNKNTSLTVRFNHDNYAQYLVLLKE